MSAIKVITGEVFPKTPTEKMPIGFDFSVSGALPTGTSISTATVAAVNHKTGETTTGTILPATTATVASDVVTAVVQAGSVGETHRITFTCTLDSGAIIQGIRLLKIVEL